MTLAIKEIKSGHTFLDARADYLMHIGGTDEKEKTALRIGWELDNLHIARGQAIRFFDAGIGSGDVLLRVLEQADEKFPVNPFRVTGKEISATDVNNTLQKMPQIFAEHPNTALFLTNLPFRQAAELTCSPAGHSLVTKIVALKGTKASTFRHQLSSLGDFIASHWGTVPDAQGRPKPEFPVILAIHREDQCTALIPALSSSVRDGHDLIIAAQPYRTVTPESVKAKNVIAPLAANLAPGGILVGVHAKGEDPAHDIIRRLAASTGHSDFADALYRHNDAGKIFEAVKTQLGSRAEGLTLSVDAQPLSYSLKPYLTDKPGSLGDSPVAVAWNSAVYVAQLDASQIGSLKQTGLHEEVTRAMLAQNGKAGFFHNEVFTIRRSLG